ncbi:acylneuraminate cytidylyltransferase family protein [Psychroserpens sp. SPM9]|uniref:acylneuraminate cytidylyltransferase family protein n=1 Tax=Psychroserpens sp. SPM9 TaxID=2975598 RepID=UPI0021A86707|nr:acylneuraminate cytidylyltransferase family protein [Psychroserpens sp. SPM9]MDG5490143.1 acylneuraminate cytidylyltransferase family protein [Psychroserpens sp. SPM9]
METLITICARGGSKGIPGKNIKPIAGKPLIGYTIEQAKKLSEKINAKIAISTDDASIKKTAEAFGVFSDYTRPDELATDTVGKIETIADIVKYEETKANKRFDFVLDLDVTSPLRTIEDLQNALQIMLDNPEAYNLFSVNKAARNPYFNMVEKNSEGYYGLVKTNPNGTVMSRQAAPEVYDLNASFYWYRRRFFDLNTKSVFTDKALIYEMKHMCFDLDHPVDFLFMEYLLKNDKLDFEL